MVSASSAEQVMLLHKTTLATMYRKWCFVAQSDTEAVKWFRKSVEQGNAFAQDNLGWMYQNGRGVKQSDREAVRLYRLPLSKDMDRHSID